MRGTVLCFALLLSLGCGSLVRKPPEPRAAVPLVGPEADAEGRAFLAMISDRRFYEPFTVRRILASQPDLREDLAIALGRIGHPRSRIVLETLLEDRRPEVRRAAAFGLGLLGENAEPVPLLVAATDADRGVGLRAIEALARLGRPLEEVRAALSLVEDEERWHRLLPALFRFEPLEIGPVARRALIEAPPALHSWAVYALGRRAPHGSADLLRTLLGDRDPWARGWAARGLGVVGDREDLELLAPLLDQTAAGPTIQTLRSARTLIESGRAAPPASWVPALERLLGDPRPGVRSVAIETAAAWLRDERLGVRLRALAREGTRWERELSLLALAEGGDSHARDLIAAAARDTDRILRARAVEAAGRVGLAAVTEWLADDQEAVVRLAVLGVRLAGPAEAAAAAARRALTDSDPAVWSAALEWLIQNPVVGVDDLRGPLTNSGARYMVRVGLNGVGALLSRARAEARERGLIVAMLEELSQTGDYPVRRRAAAALGELDRPVPPPGEFETKLGIRDYRELIRRARERRYARLDTRHGSLVLELDCPVAPLTCESFLQLANQGFYDGTTFHRVIPDVMVQAGDPRGDGWGGAGYTIRDENNRLPFDRGVIGMALSGPDTGGSQFFITLSPQPHLDGEYTAFGSVVSGDGVLDGIEQGDVILQAVEIAAPVAPAVSR